MKDHSQAIADECPSLIAANDVESKCSVVCVGRKGGGHWCACDVCVATGSSFVYMGFACVVAHLCLWYVYVCVE